QPPARARSEGSRCASLASLGGRRFRLARLRRRLGLTRLGDVGNALPRHAFPRRRGGLARRLPTGRRRRAFGLRLRLGRRRRAAIAGQRRLSLARALARDLLALVGLTVEIGVAAHLGEPPALEELPALGLTVVVVVV